MPTRADAIEKALKVIAIEAGDACKPFGHKHGERPTLDAKWLRDIANTALALPPQDAAQEQGNENAAHAAAGAMRQDCLSVVTEAYALYDDEMWNRACDFIDTKIAALPLPEPQPSTLSAAQAQSYSDSVRMVREAFLAIIRDEPSREPEEWDGGYGNADDDRREGMNHVEWGHAQIAKAGLSVFDAMLAEAGEVTPDA